ncbi:superinfection immunity protein [Tardiphaga sp. 866_E4_N2_1]|uniref:superinfection immunity protein n=1 Tax=unclassified Tardiphaga TaxID=2631404 RepID=UPI003F22C175
MGGLLGLVISLLTVGANAQSQGDVIDLFGSMVRSGITLAAQAEWERLPAREVGCVDQALRQSGSSINTAIRQGINPSDPRVAEIRAACRTQAVAPADRPGPSFNCAVANRPDEMAICSNAELSRLDRAVVARYEFLRARYGEPAARSVAGPLLRSRQSCGADVDCIRQAQLATMSEFQRRGAPAFQPEPVVPAVATKSIYSVDGLALGGRIVPDSASYRDYRCAPSEQFPDFTWCQKRRAETSPRGQYMSSNSILHTADGTARYVNRYLEPALFAGNEAQDDVNRLSIKFGPPRTISMPGRPDAPNGLIAYWGDVVLQPLDPKSMGELAAGRDVRAGLIVDHIGNFQRSARLGLPVYRLTGGAGYVWAASWDANGRGTLRFLTVDASQISPAPIASAAPPARQMPEASTAAAPPVQSLDTAAVPPSEPAKAQPQASSAATAQAAAKPATSETNANGSVGAPERPSQPPKPEAEAVAPRVIPLAPQPTPAAAETRTDAKIAANGQDVSGTAPSAEKAPLPLVVVTENSRTKGDETAGAQAPPSAPVANSSKASTAPLPQAASASSGLVTALVAVILLLLASVLYLALKGKRDVVARVPGDDKIEPPTEPRDVAPPRNADLPTIVMAVPKMDLGTEPISTIVEPPAAATEKTGSPGAERVEPPFRAAASATTAVAVTEQGSALEDLLAHPHAGIYGWAAVVAVSTFLATIGGPILLIPLLATAYLLPTFVGFKRRHVYSWAILVLNVIFGVTGLGWLALIIWAFTGPARSALDGMNSAEAIGLSRRPDAVLGQMSDREIYSGWKIPIQQAEIFGFAIARGPVIFGSDDLVAYFKHPFIGISRASSGRSGSFDVRYDVKRQIRCIAKIDAATKISVGRTLGRSALTGIGAAIFTGRHAALGGAILDYRFAGDETTETVTGLIVFSDFSSLIFECDAAHYEKFCALMPPEALSDERAEETAEQLGKIKRMADDGPRVILEMDEAVAKAQKTVDRMTVQAEEGSSFADRDEARLQLAGLSEQLHDAKAMSDAVRQLIASRNQDRMEGIGIA